MNLRIYTDLRIALVIIPVRTPTQRANVTTLVVMRGWTNSEAKVITLHPCGHAREDPRREQGAHSCGHAGVELGRGQG